MCEWFSVSVDLLYSYVIEVRYLGLFYSIVVYSVKFVFVIVRNLLKIVCKYVYVHEICIEIHIIHVNTVFSC